MSLLTDGQQSMVDEIIVHSIKCKLMAMNVYQYRAGLPALTLDQMRMVVGNGYDWLTHCSTFELAGIIGNQGNYDELQARYSGLINAQTTVPALN